jgi:uncharacterized BrkB/YihY/UPF0761 family membrane protein
MAGVLGALAGIVGFSPLIIAKHLAKRGNRTVRQHSIPLGLLFVFISLVFLFVILVVASRVAPDTFVVFGISVVIAFLATTVFVVAREFQRLR